MTLCEISFMIKENIPFDIKVATTVQNLTNEFKGNLEKILAGSHLHHNRSHAFYLKHTNSAQKTARKYSTEGQIKPAPTPGQHAGPAGSHLLPNRRGCKQGKSSSQVADCTSLGLQHGIPQLCSLRTNITDKIPALQVKARDGLSLQGR